MLALAAASRWRPAALARRRAVPRRVLGRAGVSPAGGAGAGRRLEPAAGRPAAARRPRRTTSGSTTTPRPPGSRRRSCCSATGSLEATKGLQLLVLLAAALAGVRGAGASGSRRWRRRLVAVLLAANPVALVQAFSFYVDGLSASLMTAFARAELAARCARPRAARRALASGGGAGAAGEPEVHRAGLRAACWWPGWRSVLWRWWPRRWRGFAALGGGGAGARACWGWASIPTSPTPGARPPVYPVAGAGAVDFLSIQLAPGFHQHSRPVRLAVGLLARASNDNRAPAAEAAVHRRPPGAAALPEADLRLGGFGPLFSGGSAGRV